MGIQDRDYYREEHARKHGETDYDSRSGRYRPRRATHLRIARRGLRDLPGADWHWSLKLLIWLTLACLLLAVFKHFRM